MLEVIKFLYALLARFKHTAFTVKSTKKTFRFSSRLRKVSKDPTETSQHTEFATKKGARKKPSKGSEKRRP